MTKRGKIEIEIQKKMEVETGGKHEICPAGIADIVTEKEVIEIKNWKQWKYAIGQLIVYGKYFPNRHLRCHLFGKKPEGQATMILQHFIDHNIKVTIEDNVIPIKRKRKLTKANDFIETKSLKSPKIDIMSKIDSKNIEEFINHIETILPGDVKIPREFLVRFVEIINNNQSNYFSINLEEVVDWIDYRKGHLKDLIIDDYKVDIDYTSKNINNGGKGRPKESIHLTVNCFKDLCQRLKGQTGKMVRAYFIAVEEVYRMWINKQFTNNEKVNEKVNEKC